MPAAVAAFVFPGSAKAMPALPLVRDANGIAKVTIFIVLLPLTSGSHIPAMPWFPAEGFPT